MSSRVIRWYGMGRLFAFSNGLTVSEKAVNCMPKFTECYKRFKYNHWKKNCLKILQRVLTYRIFWNSICACVPPSFKKSGLFSLCPSSQLFASVPCGCTQKGGCTFPAVFSFTHVMVISKKAPKSILNSSACTSPNSKLNEILTLIDSSKT